MCNVVGCGNRVTRVLNLSNRPDWLWPESLCQAHYEQELALRREANERAPGSYSVLAPWSEAPEAEAERA